jgi:hypothetical protein
MTASHATGNHGSVSDRSRHQLARGAGGSKPTSGNTSLEAATLARIRSVIEQIAKTRSDGGAYDVLGTLAEGQWYLHLFKRHFKVAVIKGYVTQGKLRCDTRYVSFDFDPKLQYETHSKDGACSIELQGEPETQIVLTQL